MREWKDVQSLFVENKYPEEICRIRTEYSMEWYIRKSVFYKWLYYVFSFLGIVCPLVNVILASYEADTNMAIVVLASLTSMATSLLTLTNAKQKWENYRSAAEFLKREYTLFQARVGLYEGDQRVSAYLNTIEDFMSKIHVNWQKNFKTNKDKKKKRK